MQFLDIKKGQDLWTEIILFSTFQVIVDRKDPTTFRGKKTRLQD